jgi:hypothetical protein
MIITPTLKIQQKERTNPMHEQMQRLYLAAEKIRDVTGQSAVARLLNVSPQTAKNWEARGISFEGMLDAEQFIGCSAVWLRHGIGPMVIGELYTPAANDAVARPDDLKLTCETAQELKMLSVYRLSGPDNRQLIDLAIDDAAADIGWADAFNERQ